MKRKKQRVFVVVRYDADICTVDKVFSDRDIAEQYAKGRTKSAAVFGATSFHVVKKSVQGRVK